MNDDLFLMAVVARHRVTEGPETAPHRVRRKLMAVLEEWGGRNLEGVAVSGSYAKGTAIRSHTMRPQDTDVDLFVGLNAGAAGSLADYQESLAGALRRYGPKVRNVSVRVVWTTSRWT